MPVTTEPLFSLDAAAPRPGDAVLAWGDVAEQFAAAPRYWLATGRASGRPHVAPVLAVWTGRTLAVSSRPSSVKNRNLARERNCVVTVGTGEVDLVVEGTTAQVTAVDRQHELAETFRAKYDWRFSLRDGRVFDDGMPGSPEYAFFEITPVKGFGYSADGRTATRWRF